MLGFDDKLIAENKLLGLKERPLKPKEFMIEVEAQQAFTANVHVESKIQKSENTIKETDNEDWKYTQIIPGPKKVAEKNDLVAISDLPKYCQSAFAYTETLNHIQSIVYPTAFKQSRNMIVAAPTGAGKTNVALMTILR